MGRLEHVPKNSHVLTVENYFLVLVTRDSRRVTFLSFRPKILGRSIFCLSNFSQSFLLEYLSDRTFSKECYAKFNINFELLRMVSLRITSGLTQYCVNLEYKYTHFFKYPNHLSDFLSLISFCL
jgi:hypothetical protein